MKCYFCREEVPDGAKFCPNCGAEVKKEDTYENSYAESDLDSEFDLRASDVFEEVSPEEKNADQSNDTGMDFSYGQWSGSAGNQENPYREVESDGGKETEPKHTYGVPGMDPQPNGYQYQQGSEQNVNETPQRINSTEYIILSIFSIILCCVPLGIVALINAIRINSLQNAGDFARAKKAAKASRNCMIIGAIVTLICTIGFVVTVVRDPEFKQILNEAMDEIEEEDSNELEQADAEEDSKEDSKEVVDEKNVGDGWTSGKIQIKDAVVTIPCSVEDMEAAGFKMDDYSVEETTEVAAHDYVLVYFSDDHENQICAIMFNDSDDAVATKDATIGGVDILSYAANDVTLPGGITLESSVDDVKKAYGEPDYKSDGEEDGDYISYEWYTDDDEEVYTYLSVEFEKESGKIFDISLMNMGKFEWRY